MATFLPPPLTQKLLCAIGGVCLVSASAVAQGAELSGQLRSAWVQRPVADSGPLAQANQVQAETAAIEPSATTMQAELGAAGSGGALALNAGATLPAPAPPGPVAFFMGLAAPCSGNPSALAAPARVELGAQGIAHATPQTRERMAP